MSSVDAEAETFRPLSSRMNNTALGKVDTVYHPGEVEWRRQGKDGVEHKKLDDNVIDNEEAMHWTRRLPLKEGYKATMPIFSPWSGEGVPVELEVQAKETVEAPAGKFECYKVHLSIGQRFWFSTDEHRYLVKVDAGPVNMLLTSIVQRQADEPVKFQDDELGVSLTAPPQWVVCRIKTDQQPLRSTIRLFDADADLVEGKALIFPTEKLSADEQKSSKAWAESELKKNIMTLSSDVKVRPDSWKDSTVLGRPAVSFVADYTTVGKPETIFSLYALGPKDSVRFAIVCPPDKFDALRKQFEGIIASYSVK